MKILLVLISFWVGVIYAEDITFSTTLGNDIEIKTYPSESKNLLIYLPGQRGLGKEYVQWANELNFDDFNIWALDLHASYMISPSRNSPQKFIMQDVLDVLKQAEGKFDNIYVLTVSRGAKFSLEVAYHHQINNPQHKLKGIIMHSPHLIKGNAEIGNEAEYEQIAKYSNLPLYLIFSQYSTKYARASEIVNVLKTGGSSVFTQMMKNTSAGFFMRPNKDLTITDISNKNKLGAIYTNAINLLKNQKVKQLKTIKKIDNSTNRSKFKSTLSSQNFAAKELILTNLDGKQIDLKDYKNKVVLLNFWASWCKPCVKEIPSLMRLKNKVNNDNFEILTVNIGESKNKIMSFKKKVKFDLETLLDTDGKYANLWNIYAYPSNYIWDKNLVVRYGYRGALEWDRDDIVKTINELLNEK
jgi:thiol-disulfide isomerase/thioredoxin